MAKKKKTAPKRAKKTKKTTAKKPKRAKGTKQKPTAKKPKRAKKVKTTARRAPKTKAPAPTPIDIGVPAPTFALPTDAGGALDLAEFQGRKNVVLYFYPKDDTPGCTVEACTFEQDRTDYAAHDAVVVGVSADSADSHARFRQKYNLSFPLVVDEGARLANRYGVLVEKNNYGKRYMGIQRATFLIDKQGRVAKVWPRVKVEGHSAEVLAALKGLA